MVSTWRFYSFKDLNLRHRHPFQIFILICAFFGLLVAFHHYMLFIVAISYALSGVITRLSYVFKRKPLGTIQYSGEPAAIESRKARKKILRWLADSRWRRSGCRDHPSGKGISHPVAATGAAMVCLAHCRRIPHGEYLALLQF